jgi:hypothetical protein
MSRLAADNPAHRRIMPQTLSVIHVLVPSNAAKHRLSEQPGQDVPAILPDAGVGQDIARQRRQSKHIIDVAMSKQPRIGGHR